MRQQTLTDFDPSYATPAVIEDFQEGSVFFKTKDGKIHQGELYKESSGWYFEGVSYYDVEEVESWHPIRVDI